jgi:6-phosphogluconolactonase (cycloisomerase 2 family)
VHKAKRLGVAAGVTLAANLALAPQASAAKSTTATATQAPGADCGCGRDAVFVQTDNPLGNQIVAYRRAEDGTLSWAGVYNTGGLGGVLSGSVVDHLASQGSLTYDPQRSLLYAVNAGSNTVSVFSVEGQRLTLRQVVGSGGHFPVSVAVHDDVVYVLNALAGGSVQGYRVAGGRLHAVPAWHRDLGLDPNAAPQFVNTPGQVGFTGDGSQLVVTTKANGNAVVVFRLDKAGGVVGAPVVNAEPGTVPFAFVDAGPRHLFLTQAGPNAVATVRVDRDGTATRESVADTGQAATCWVTTAGDFLYASNAGSNTVSGFRIGADRQLTPLGPTATDPGTVDAAASADHRYLYVQTGGEGIVDEFKINPDGSLTAIGTQPVPNAVGGEGIVAL